MTNNHTTRRRTARGLALVAGVATAGLVLAGCTTDSAPEGGGGVNAGGPSVPYGASVEEWQAAFADVEEPIELVWEVPTSATSAAGLLMEPLVEKAAELSGGKLIIEISYSLSVSGGLTEVDQALQDGRLDLAMITPYLESQDYPIAGTLGNDINITYPTAQVGGAAAGFAASTQTLWDTPEFIQEMSDAGLHVLSPYSSVPRSVLSCSKPVETLDDLKGLQVRVAPITNFRQVEALGATPVSIPFTELFESVQRGIVDCIVSGISTVGALPGLAELLPYQISPVGTNWSGTAGYYVAGSSWEGLPLAAQQLIYDLNMELELANLPISSLQESLRVYELSQSVGGEWLNFDDDVNSALADFNQTLITDEWEGSPLLDGAAYMDRLDANLETWVSEVEGIGFSFAEFGDVEDWSTSDPDWDAFGQLYQEKIAAAHRPS